MAPRRHISRQNCAVHLPIYDRLFAAKHMRSGEWPPSLRQSRRENGVHWTLATATTALLSATQLG